MSNKTISQIDTTITSGDLDSTKYFPVGDSTDDSTAKISFTELQSGVGGIDVFRVYIPQAWAGNMSEIVVTKYGNGTPAQVTGVVLSSSDPLCTISFSGIATGAYLFAPVSNDFYGDFGGQYPTIPQEFFSSGCSAVYISNLSFAPWTTAISAAIDSGTPLPDAVEFYFSLRKV